MNREDFLARRNSGIGGSDISAVLGLNPWTSPYVLWTKKTGRHVEDFDDEQLERMMWGNALEDVVARHFAQKNEVKIQRVNAQLVHPSCPIAIGNIDRAVLEPGKQARWTGQEIKGAQAVLEVKTAGAFALFDDEWGEPGTDQVPMHYYLQVQWYLGLAGIRRGVVAVLFGGQKYREFNITFDRDLFDDLINEAGEWWERYVKTDTPPDCVNADDARARWKSHTARKEFSVTDPEIADAIVELSEVKAWISEAKKRESAILDKILPAVGDAELITSGGKVLATWKKNKDSVKTDWETAFEALIGVADIPGDLIAELVQKNQKIAEGARVFRMK